MKFTANLIKKTGFVLIMAIVVGLLFSGGPFFFRIPAARAAVAFVGCGAASAVGSGNMTSVGIPSGIQNNDILITYVHTRDNVDSSMPADWTNNVAGNGNTTNRLEIFWKRTAGSESAPTVTHSGGNSSIATMCAFRGVDTADSPFNAVGSVQSNAGSPISTAAISTTVNNAMIIHVFGSNDNNAWGSYTGIPTNEAAQNDNASGSDDSSGMTYGAQSTAGSTGTAGASQTLRGPDAGVSVLMALRPFVAVTTLGDGSDPSNAAVAPGAAATDLDAFTLQTNTGADTVTAATVTLSAGSSGGLSLVAITNDAGSVTYCSQADPPSDSVSLSSCGIPVTTSLTQFKIRITPKIHADMPVPPGSDYSVTGTITSFTSTNSQSGADADSATVTIDNASPANVTGASGTAGDSQVSLSWTNPADSDFHSAVVLRRAGAATSDAPAEGAVYVVGNAVGSSIVACVVASPSSGCADTGLTNGTEYHYRIFARDNNVNYSDTGAVPTGSPFTPVATPDTTPPAAVTDLALSDASDSAITVSWTAPGDDGNTGTATSYDLRYSTSLITAGNFDSATQVTGEPAPQPAGTSQSKVVSGLSPSTLYYFALKTSDEVPNTSSISNVPSLSTTETPDTTPPAAVTDLATGTVTSSSIAISWTAPGDDGNTGTATSYDVRYSTSPITGDAQFNVASQATGEPVPSVAGSAESMTVTGLSSGTTYYFALKTSDEVPNVSAMSNAPSLATAAEGGGVPQPSAGGGGPGVAPRRAVFSGQAYPQSKIEILRKSMTDEIYAQVPSEHSQINPDGTFLISFTGLIGADYLFALRAYDKDNRNTGVLTFNVSLFGDLFEAKDILVSPTVGLSKSLISKNDVVKLRGYAGPGFVVKLEVDGLKREDVKADSSGLWSFDLGVTYLTYGDHRVRARQVSPDGKTASNFSLSRIFRISQMPSLKADINNDGMVTIGDWSIFLFRWGSKNEELRMKNDLNNDGKVNVFDLSIFLQAMRK